MPGQLIMVEETLQIHHLVVAIHIDLIDTTIF